MWPLSLFPLGTCLRRKGAVAVLRELVGGPAGLRRGRGVLCPLTPTWAPKDGPSVPWESTEPHRGTAFWVAVPGERAPISSHGKGHQGLQHHHPTPKAPSHPTWGPCPQTPHLPTAFSSLPPNRFNSNLTFPDHVSRVTLPSHSE